jgi:release factor glutamine methyltransferase
MESIYQPEEDSYLFAETLKEYFKNKYKNKNKNIQILDMGSGSGILIKTLIEEGIGPKNLTLVDINKEAIKHLKKNFRKSKIINSDLFEKIKGKFDLIIFNPPYLPLDKDEPVQSRLATTGGKYGGELISKFLNKAKKHLKSSGKILLLVSNHTKKIDFSKYHKKLLKKKKLFFEELYIYELWSI